METITYLNLKVDGAPIKKVTSLTISNAANSYGTVQLSGEVEPAEGEGFAARADENTCFTIRTSAAGQPPVLFMGVAESVSLSKSSEYALLNLTLRAEASRLNTKKEHRSFQNTGSTYEEVINKALGGKAGLQMNVSDKATGRLIVQYNETAWEFALRMASEFGAPLCANVETQVPQLTVGVPETGNTYQLSDVEYDFGSNGNAYEKMKSNSGNSYMQEDFSGTGISTDQYVMLGDTITYGGQTQQVQQFCSTLKNGILRTSISAAVKTGFTQALQPNAQVSGKMFLGEVKAVEKDKVQVHLVDIDDAYDSGGNLWLPYSTAYSSSDGSGFYCMPQEGDSVRVFFPSDNEKDAFCASSVNVSPLDDPKHKKWRSPAGKEILFTEKGIFITCNEQRIYINLEDENGISICADKDINVCSNNNILLYAQNTLQVQSENKILLSTGNSYIDITKESIQLGAKNVVIK